MAGDEVVRRRRLAAERKRFLPFFRAKAQEEQKKVRKPFLGKTRYYLREAKESGALHAAGAVIWPVVAETLLREATEERIPGTQSPYFKAFAASVGGTTPVVVGLLGRKSLKQARYKGIDIAKLWGRLEAKEAKFDPIRAAQEEQKEFHKAVYTFFDPKIDPVTRKHALERWVEEWASSARLRSGRKLSFRIERELEQTSREDLKNLMTYMISHSNSDLIRKSGRLYNSLGIRPERVPKGVKFPEQLRGIVPEVNNDVEAFGRRFDPKSSWEALAFSLFILRMREEAKVSGSLQQAIHLGQRHLLVERQTLEKTMPKYFGDMEERLAKELGLKKRRRKK